MTSFYRLCFRPVLNAAEDDLRVTPVDTADYPVRPLEPGEPPVRPLEPGSRSNVPKSVDALGPVDLGADPRKMGHMRRTLTDTNRSKSPLNVRQKVTPFYITYMCSLKHDYKIPGS